MIQNCSTEYQAAVIHVERLQRQICAVCNKSASLRDSILHLLDSHGDAVRNDEAKQYARLISAAQELCKKKSAAEDARRALEASRAAREGKQKVYNSELESLQGLRDQLETTKRAVCARSTLIETESEKQKEIAKRTEAVRAEIAALAEKKRQQMTHVDQLAERVTNAERLERDAADQLKEREAHIAQLNNDIQQLRTKGKRRRNS